MSGRQAGNRKVLWTVQAGRPRWRRGVPQLFKMRRLSGDSHFLLGRGDAILEQTPQGRSGMPSGAGGHTPFNMAPVRRKDAMRKLFDVNGPDFLKVRISISMLQCTYSCEYCVAASGQSQTKSVDCSQGMTRPIWGGKRTRARFKGHRVGRIAPPTGSACAMTPMESRF